MREAICSHATEFSSETPSWPLFEGLAHRYSGNHRARVGSGFNTSFLIRYSTLISQELSDAKRVAAKMTPKYLDMESNFRNKPGFGSGSIFSRQNHSEPGRINRRGSYICTCASRLRRSHSNNECQTKTTNDACVTEAFSQIRINFREGTSKKHFKYFTAAWIIHYMNYIIRTYPQSPV